MSGGLLHDSAWERRPRHWLAAAVFTPAAVILGAGLLGVPGVERPDFADEAQPQATAVPSVVSVIASPAVVAPPAAADRRGTVESIPAPTSSWVELVPPVTITAARTCREQVNAITFEYLNVEPAREAYRIVARCEGWPADVVVAWEAFIVDDVIRGESGGCPNLRRGARVVVAVGCVVAYVNEAGQWVSTQGTSEDSGFGQLIGLWWRGAGTPVCDRLGLCSSNAVIGSPYDSMHALLVAVEVDGKGPWCFNARARAWHPTCAVTPRRWPS